MDIEEENRGRFTQTPSTVTEVAVQPFPSLIISNVFGKDDIIKDRLLQSIVTVDCNKSKSVSANSHHSDEKIETGMHFK